MLKRMLVSVVILPCLFLVVWAPLLHALPFFLFLLAISVLGSLEVARLQGLIFGRDGAAWFAVPAAAVLAAGYTTIAAHVSTRASILIVCAVPAVTWVAALAGRGWRRGNGLAARSAANLVYLGLAPLVMLIRRQAPDGVAMTCFLFLAAWGNDAAAYLVGSRWGRVRGIVSWSPNKSVEGYAGALACTLALTAGFKLVVGEGLSLSLPGTLAAGLAVSVIAPAGDLLESLFKRRAGVKDSSGLIPGMGGVLDVFDSVLPSAPAVYLLAHFLG
jgi:phosphatidate cytidylyltransferase